MRAALRRRRVSRKVTQSLGWSKNRRSDSPCITALDPSALAPSHEAVRPPAHRGNRSGARPPGLFVRSTLFVRLGLFLASVKMMKERVKRRLATMLWAVAE